MARISTYEQDSSLHKQDKLIGSDSVTNGTKNFTIGSLIQLINELSAINVFDGLSYEYQAYAPEATDPEGILNVTGTSLNNTAFSAITQIIISKKGHHSPDVENYINALDGARIKISEQGDIDNFGIFRVVSIQDYTNTRYMQLTLQHDESNGTLTAGTRYHLSNYQASIDSNLTTRNVTEFGDVFNAGSGYIITQEERNIINNALVHSDVVDNVTSTAADVPLSANQGKVLKGLIDSINTLLTSDNVSLDTLQEVVDYIETNRNTLNSLAISNITGLQSALNGKQNTEAGKGLSTNDFTNLLLSKLNGIADNAEVNVQPDWNATTGDGQILNKPNNFIYTSSSVTDLNDVLDAGSGYIITDAERVKLNGIAAGAEVNVQPDWNATSGDAAILNKPTLAPSDAEANVQANWNETDSASDAFIQNKPDITVKADKNTTITVQGTTNEIEVSPNTAQDLSANRTVTIGLPNDVTIGNDLTVSGELNVDGGVGVDDYVSFTGTDPQVNLDLGTGITPTYSYNFADSNSQSQAGAPVFINYTFPSAGSDLNNFSTSQLSWGGNNTSTYSQDWIDLATDLGIPGTHTGYSSIGFGTFSSTQHIVVELADGSYFMFGATGWQSTALGNNGQVSLNGSVVQGSGAYNGAQGFTIKAGATPGVELSDGIYVSTDDNHNTMHFRYHDHDLSIDYLTQNIPTGILDGGVLAKVDATTFSISAGDGIINILNKGTGTDPHPEIKKVKWDAQNISHTQGDANNADQLNTWVYINSSGTVVQSTTVPGPSVYRDNIVLGSIIHASNTIIFTKTFPRTSYSTGNTYAEFAEIFGPLKKSGHNLTVNTSNTLALDRAQGVSFALGRNYVNDPENPSIVDDAASTPTFHRYSSTSTGFTKDDGAAGAGYASIDPGNYDNNGTLTSMQNSKFSVQRLYHFPNNTNTIVAYYGKNYYDSIDEAEKNYLLEDFKEADNTSTQAIYLGALIVKGDATDLGNSGQAKILTGGIFRSLAAVNAGGVAAGAALGDLIDVDTAGAQDGEGLVYVAANGRWEPGEVSTDLTPITLDTTNNRVGINNTVPTDPLTVNGTAKIQAATGAALTFGQSSNQYQAAVKSSAHLVLQSGASSQVIFKNNGTTYMMVDSDGDVGIGTTSPSSKLNIVSTGNDPHALTVQDDARKTKIGRGSIQSTDLTDAVSTLYLNSGGGNVSIPSSYLVVGTTSPSASLHVRGSSGGGGTSSLLLESSTGTDRFNFRDDGTMTWGVSASSGQLSWDTNEARILGLSGQALNLGSNGTTDRLFIATNGTIGINTDQPSVMLDINGTDAIKLPSGTTAQRPATPAAGMFRYNTEDAQFEGYTTEWGAIAGSGGGTSTFNKDLFSGDDSTTSFTMAQSISDENNTQVYIDGVYQSKENYTVNGTAINFSTAPPTGTNNIEVISVTSVALEDTNTLTRDGFTGDGSTTAFTLSVSPTNEDLTFVYIQGVYQEKSTYSISGSTITFTTAPQNGYTFEVMSLTAANITQTSYMASDSFSSPTQGQTSFTLVNGTPSNKSFTMVFISGVYQDKSTYSLTSGAIVLSQGVDTEDTVEVISIGNGGVIGKAVSDANDARYSVNVISANDTAVAGAVYVFTASLTLTLPASPEVGESIKISNRSDVATCVLGRNGNKIMGDAEDLTLDTASASFELIYSGSAQGWVIIGQ